MDTHNSTYVYRLAKQMYGITCLSITSCNMHVSPALKRKTLSNLKSVIQGRKGVLANGGAHIKPMSSLKAIVNTFWKWKHWY